MNKNQLAITKIIEDDVKKAVYNALELINAQELFKKPDLKVLLKPNILGAKEPKKAVTTHPEVLRAVIQWVKQFKPEKIIVAESSGTQKRGATEEAFEVSGLKKVCEEEKIEWTTFAKTPRKKYAIENPLILEEVVSSSLLEEVDLIINLPKIKTHGQCTLTCCIKNMFGTLILGNKAQTHATYPTLEKFSSALADIYSVSNPQLTIIDGFYGMEGNGPSAGDIVKMDIILAGYDPVALDTLVCKIVDFNPKDIIHVQKAEQRGLGSSDLSKYEIHGDPIKSVKRKFKKPKTHMVSLPLPKSIAEYVGRVIFKSTIKFDKDKCKLCGTCWKNCPVNAISPPAELKQGEFIPKWDKNKCITCYCCAELCPYEAVDFKINFVKNVATSWLGIFALGIIIFLVYGIVTLIIWMISLF